MAQAGEREWGLLAEKSEEEERRRLMEARYTELAALAEETRRSRLLPMAQAEYALSDDALRRFTMSRLQVWLHMDQEMAKKIAESYDAVMTQLPATAAMRRVALVQTLARNFSPDDQARLRTLLPRVFAGAGEAAQARTRAPEPAAAPAMKKAGWQFWKK